MSVATPPYRRILCVKLADIGDLILTTPALAALREAFPTAQIDMLTTRGAAAVLNGSGLIDETIPFEMSATAGIRDLIRPAGLAALWKLRAELARRRYDALFYFHQFSTRFGALKHALIALGSGAAHRYGLDNGRGWFLTHRLPDSGFGGLHQAEYWLQMVGLAGADPDPARSPTRIGISEADRAWAAAALPDGRYMAVHPGSGALNPARRWDADKIATAAAQIAARDGLQPVIVGGKDDGAEAVLAHLPGAVNLAGKTTLGQLAAVLGRCTAYLGADSGVMHIAATIPHLRLYTLFGPTNHQAWGAWQSGARILPIRSGALCSPCGYVGHGVGLRSGCAARSCMKAITPEQVIAGQPHDAIRQRAQAPALRVLGIPVDALTFDGLIGHIAAWIKTPAAAPRLICTANPELVMTAQRDPLFYHILQRCDLVTADGVGLLWAAKRLGHPLPERVTGSDGLPLIAARAAREGWRVYLLGAGPGVAEQVAERLTAQAPGLQVVGTYSGSPDPAEEDALIARINAAGPDILFVAYGSPTQEKWLARNLPRLRVKVALGVGGAFNFVAGIAPRAPLWMRRAGLEWLHRLIKQPWRWRRMLRLPRFVWAVLQRGQRGPESHLLPLKDSQ